MARLIPRRSILLPMALVLSMTATLAGPAAPGAVYVASNATGANEVLVFEASVRGDLIPAGAVATGGQGTGGGLGNQGGLVLDANERTLYVVNAGSDSLTALAVAGDGLERIDTYPSGGRMPISIALHDRLLYVLHAGGAVGDVDGVAGFRVAADGSLSPIDGSFRELDQASSGPAQAGFSPDGRYLVVTEKATNTIDVFPVLDDGTLGNATFVPSVGATPFGFSFGKRGQLLVSEAFGGMADASAVTVYELDRDGSLGVVDPSVPTTETAACWVALSPDGRHAYTTNTGSGTVTGFAVAADGGLHLLDPDGATGTAGAGPIDLDFSRNGRVLYVLSSGSHTVSGFRVAPHGRLAALPSVAVPMGANGLAAR